MILVLGNAVVDLQREVVDVGSCPDRNVHFEQPVEGVVQGGADEVAACGVMN